LASDREEVIYKREKGERSRFPKAVGLGVVSAASAILGGLAVAWWHRKTLVKLQNPIVTSEIQKSELSESPELVDNP
jgi:hypothetical protein